MGLDDDEIEYEVLAEGKGTWRSVPVTEGVLCWRCPKCGLVVEDLTVEQVTSVAETHEEFVHRLGLFIPEQGPSTWQTVAPDDPVRTQTKVPERWVATLGKDQPDLDGRPLQVLVTRWPTGAVTVAVRSDESDTWGPPAEAEPR